MATIECICPPRADGTPRHEHGDTVTLRERLDFVGLSRARNVVLELRADAHANAPEMTAAVSEAYLLHGIESWTVVDAAGDPVRPTKDAIREYLLARPLQAVVVGDEADNMYSDSLMESLRPLLTRESASSLPTLTDASTSRPTDSRPKRQKHSKRSSTSTSRTGGIVRITPSPDGDSSSWPSSASAR